MKVLLSRLPALDSALIRFDAWWNGLSRREHILLGTVGALLFAVMLIYGVVKPIQSARAAALADIRTYETLNARILAAGTLAPTRAPRPQGAPAKIAGDSAARMGLVVTPEVMPGGVRVTIADASYDTILSWLADLAGTSDLRATRVAIQRGTAPGRASATVELAG